MPSARLGNVWRQRRTLAGLAHVARPREAHAVRVTGPPAAADTPW